MYTRAWSTLEGSEWQSLLEPTHIEMMRFRKEWDAKCYGDDGTAT